MARTNMVDTMQRIVRAFMMDLRMADRRACTLPRIVSSVVSKEYFVCTDVSINIASGAGSARAGPFPMFTNERTRRYSCNCLLE